jgi:hypothetical protein
MAKGREDRAGFLHAAGRGVEMSARHIVFAIHARECGPDRKKTVGKEAEACGTGKEEARGFEAG